MRSDSERITSHFKINAGKIFANIINYSGADRDRKDLMLKFVKAQTV